MNIPPLVSILLGFFDAERFLEETVETVFDQTLTDWELLLVDDGSSDGSSAMAERYAGAHPDRVHYLTHVGGRNRGVCASRNLGLRHARGRYVAILDADDVWEQNKLSEQTKILEDHPQVGMVFGAARYWRSWDKAATGEPADYTPVLGIEPDRVHEPPRLLKRCHPLGRATAPSPSDLLLRRELVLSVNGFEEAFTGPLQMYEDQAFLAKIYLSAPVYVSSKTWTRYRLHADSCCHRVMSSGAEPMVRRYFLDWLDGYLATEDVEDASIHRSLNRAKMVSRNLWASRLLNAPSELKQQLKRLLR